MTVDENMNATVQSDIEKKTQKGIVTKVATLPKNNPHIQTDSMYPVEVKLQNPDNKLLSGHHVFLSIITEEVKGAFVVPVTAVEKDGALKYIWILTEKGNVEKRKVETGLAVNGQQQIKSGVKAGEYYIVYPDEIPALQKGAAFITALDWDKVKLRDLKKFDRPTIVENLLLGILERK